MSRSRALIAILILFTLGCVSENAEDLANKQPCEDPGYNTDIEPLMNTYCALSGCHIGSPGRPDLSQKQEVIDNAQRIKFRVVNRTMPPPSSGLVLTQEEIDLISCWVDAGAQDN